jgi:DNA-binding transcriptional LysR family regulator
VLLPRLHAFRALHPDVEIAVTLSIPLRDVQGLDADVEVRFGRGLYPSLVTLDLLDEPVFAVCSPAFARAHRLDHPEALAHVTLLRSELEPWAPWFVAAGLRWPEPQSGPRYEDLALLYQAAMDSEGVALARATLAKTALDSGALIRPFAITARSPHAYYLACRPPALHRPEVEAFVTWLQASVRALQTV